MATGDRLRTSIEDLVAKLDPKDLERISAAILKAVDEVSSSRWDAAVARAAKLKGDVRPQKVAALTRQISTELAAMGAGAGAAAATPLVGTTATLLATTAELGWFTARAGDLILTIAALHGRPEPTVDERRAWVLAVLIYGGSARDGFARALNEAGTGLSPAGGALTKVPLSTLQQANRVLSRLLIRRYGARRGMVALGTALPLGMGAVIGGSANFVAVRRLAKSADRFFAALPYSSIETTAIDIAGALPPPQEARSAFADADRDDRGKRQRHPRNL